MNSAVAFVLRHVKWFGYTSAALSTAGVLGYLVGRMSLASSGFVSGATYVMLVGVALGAALISAHASRTQRPQVLRLLAATCVLYGVLTVLFPYSRGVAFPEAGLTLVAIVLLVFGWSDLCDPTLWRNAPPNREWPGP